MGIPRGRPRLTPELYQERLSAYCARYQVAPLETGLPPFPAGQRETPQHSEWMSLYKAHQRIARHVVSAEDRRALLEAQDGRCPVCGEKVDPKDAPSREWTTEVRAVLHPRCGQLAGLAEALGPSVLDRLRAFLWPSRKPSR
jgi:hypothetical protein